MSILTVFISPPLYPVSGFSPSPFSFVSPKFLVAKIGVEPQIRTHSLLCILQINYPLIILRSSEIIESIIK